MEVLQSISAQQDDHKTLIEQVTGFQKYWDLQQTWNDFARKNRRLKEKKGLLFQKHRDEAKAEWTSRVEMSNHFDVLEKHSRAKRTKEMETMDQELADHGWQWSGFIQPLNMYQEAMHPQWSGRIPVAEHLSRAYDRNRSVMQTTMRRLQQRMEQKQQV
ncbi:unnamed protein product, partial [Sphacelaria rigidula]